MYWAASCGGCDISLLEIGARMLELIKIADVVFWPCAADFKYEDVRTYPDGYMDYCFFNGAVRNSEQEEIARLLRQKSKILIAYGECAIDGGIPGAGQSEEPRRRSTTASYHLESLDGDNRTRTEPQDRTPTAGMAIWRSRGCTSACCGCTDIVPVDYLLPGCPPQADRVWEAILALASGGVPRAQQYAVKVGCTDKAVCDECPREKKLVKIKAIQAPAHGAPRAGMVPAGAGHPLHGAGDAQRLRRLVRQGGHAAAAAVTAPAARPRTRARHDRRHRRPGRRDDRRGRARG